jgi:hypothetical protein
MIQPGGRTSPRDGLTIEAPSQRTGRFEQDPAVSGIEAQRVSVSAGHTNRSTIAAA